MYHGIVGEWRLIYFIHVLLYLQSLWPCLEENIPDHRDSTKLIYVLIVRTIMKSRQGAVFTSSEQRNERTGSCHWCTTTLRLNYDV